LHFVHAAQDQETTKTKRGYAIMSLPRRTLSYSLIIAMAGGFVSLQSGCEDLPGSRTEQATVIGGAAGAGIGAVLAE